MRKIVTATALAIVLVFGCIQGAMWQFDRYQVRHANNSLIMANVSKPAISETELNNFSDSKRAWREAQLTGNFISTKEILVRNRYHEGKYGFGVITLFKSEQGRFYWVDRGWVVAGKDALTPPITKPVTENKIELLARVRVENIENQIAGSVFAVPNGKDSKQLEKWNQTGSVTTQDLYLDLISTSDPKLDPDVPSPLPEISDGPHLAYSFQWLIFALLVAVALFLVIREERKAQREKL
ncbi:MAG: SURF1 family protein [Candidatus Nanopelagicaceae bacterium]|nr:SURF1 family protein [Candidatus Nanopelagicaceae bacterium]